MHHLRQIHSLESFQREGSVTIAEREKLRRGDLETGRNLVPFWVPKSKQKDPL